jgi:TPR repeat protein
MESNVELNKLLDLIGKYEIKISKKELIKFSKDIILKLINLYLEDKVDNKCNDNLYLKYLGLYHQYKTKDYDKMEEAYFILLNKGDTEIMLRLGDFYKDTEEDIDEMKRFYLMAIKKGNNEGYMRLAEYFKKKNNLYYKKCLEKGINNNGKKLVEMGYYYQYTEKNYDMMMKYYELAIKQNDPLAMNNLGVYNQDIIYNLKEAEILYKLSADKDCIFAMNNLGLLYQRKRKYEEMEKYFQMAIAKDDTDAMYNLGIFYETISGLPEIAQQYYQTAADKGNEKAKKRLAELLIGDNVV